MVILITNPSDTGLNCPRLTLIKTFELKKCGNCHKTCESNGLKSLVYGLLGFWRIFHYLTPSPGNSNGSDSAFGLMSFQINLKSQSIQRARLFLQSSELDPPAPSPASECCPPHLVPRGGGGTHSLAGEGAGGGAISTKGQAL